MSRHASRCGSFFVLLHVPYSFEIACVLVGLDYLASVILNANHGIM